jgi:hypothetical protein
MGYMIGPDDIELWPEDDEERDEHLRLDPDHSTPVAEHNPAKVSDDLVEDLLNSMFEDEGFQNDAHQYCLANLGITAEQWVAEVDKVEIMDGTETPMYSWYWHFHSRFWMTLLTRAQAKLSAAF